MATLLGRLRARHLSVCLSVGERVNEHTRRCRCAHRGQRTIETDVPHWSMPLELAVLVRLAVESPRSLPPQCWGPEHQSLSWFRGSNSGPHDHKTVSSSSLSYLPSPCLGTRLGQKPQPSCRGRAREPMGPGQRTLEHCQPEEGLAARSRLPTALLPSTAGTPKVSSLENTVSLASHKTEEIFFSSQT